MITVMSFNIRTRSAPDGRNAWEYRRRLVVDRIRLCAPDLLGLQECRNDSQARFLQRSLPEYRFIAYERGGEGDTAVEMAPILVRNSSFQILDFGCFWLSETPALPGSLSWGSHFPRTVTWAKLREARRDSREVIFFNTHFDYANLQVQVESSRLLGRHLAALENHPAVILCGDFNAEKGSEPYAALLSANAGIPSRLHDVYVEAHPNARAEAGTFHDFGALSRPQALDWILATSHLAAIGAEVDGYQQGGRYPSDHSPLIARLEFCSP